MADSDYQTQSFNIRDYYQLVSKRKWYLIMPTIIAPLAAVLITFFMTPIYQSSTSILMKEASILPPVVQQELNINQNLYRRPTNAELQNTVASQIKSAKYIRSLIAKLDIPIPDQVKEAVAHKSAELIDVSSPELAENLLVKSIKNKIDVSVSGGNIINITVQSNSPVMAHKMTQTLAEIFLEETLAQELAGIQGNISFTEEQLAVYRDKLYNAQNQLKLFRQNVIEASVDQDTSTLNYNLNSIFSAVEALDIEINNAEDQQNRLRISLMPHQVDLAAVNLPSNILGLKQELMNTIPDLAELLGRYSWRDAKVVSLNKEAKDLNDSLTASVATYVSSMYPNLSSFARDDLAEYLMLEINIEYMRNKSAAMSRSIARLKSRLTANPDIEVTLDRLQSEVDRYAELYNLFMQHSQYAAIDQSAKKIEAESKYMIVQPAEMPLGPESPSRAKMGVMGLVLGLMIGVGIILLLGILDDSYKKVEDVEKDLKLPVLATIPVLNTPYKVKRRERGLIYAGTVISILLVAAILFMKFRNG